MKKTIGGDRIGSGKRMTVDLKTYNRSTHDLGYLWKSTMAVGTLVPFMNEVMLPGDTFDIKLRADAMTKPTVGPLFGSFKLQLDTYMCPVRLYNGKLHNNALAIGMDMSKIKLPQVEIKAKNPPANTNWNGAQINPSSIFAYLGINGIGINATSGSSTNQWTRQFNAVPYLAYWDIYKNYYANKQETMAAVLHTDPLILNKTITTVQYGIPTPSRTIPQYPTLGGGELHGEVDKETIEFTWSGNAPLTGTLWLYTDRGWFVLEEMFARKTIGATTWTVSAPVSNNASYGSTILAWGYSDQVGSKAVEPKVRPFPLYGIDEARETILSETKSTSPLVIDQSGTKFGYPYILPLEVQGDNSSIQYSQEGLGLKTYQSDIFNNWMKTDWIDGTNGINEITAIDTSSGSFNIDTLVLSKKVYNMLNRIAISGGSYDDWLEAVYTHERRRGTESPMYMGGLHSEVIFQQVVSNSQSENQPLGTLAGRGTLGGNQKGGNVTIKADEPCYAIGIVSLTPRLDYSQGNKWDVNLKTMDDFHKPALDEIGFQDLITEHMAYWDTETKDAGVTLTRRSAGKQPSWINYMTNVNRTYGNFALDDNEMFMTLNRRYEYVSSSTGRIKDLTTYIDPAKYNYIFSEISRDAQNFWIQIAVDITARRKMSAKIMPNL